MTITIGSIEEIVEASQKVVPVSPAKFVVLLMLAQFLGTTASVFFCRAIF